MAASIAIAIVTLGSIGLPSAAAAPGDIGYEDMSFAGTSEPTGTKRAESLLWWNDGSWWANMWDTTSGDFHIFRLDVATQTWVDTETQTDGRSNSHADVLWSGGHLYVASHLAVNDELPAEQGYPSYLYRFSYNGSTDTYSLDSGFPVLINNYKTETLVIDRDSTGTLWATWQQANRIYVNRTLNGDDRTWGTPFQLPVAATDVTVDDTSAVIAFGGNKIGVLWSNQTSANDAMWFAVHIDGQPDTTWQAARTAIQGSNTADDHMNLKSLQSDGSGRVYAAIKTSFTSSAQPLIMLLVRDPATGDWVSYPISRVSDCPNRPLVLIDEQNRVLHAFFSAPAPTGSCTSSGGAIHEKTSSLDSIAFPVGTGTPVIVDYGSVKVHNATSTKQNVNAQTGIVVLARNSDTDRYWHHYQALSGGPPPAPVANFSATPTTGTAPLAVGFTDLSTNSPTSWSWTFGDGGTSTAQNPSHTYAASGTYTVTLTASNAGGSDAETKTNYITVSGTPPPPPTANFTGSPTSGLAPLTVSFSDTSTGGPTSWSWAFGDGGTSTAQNPSHTYAGPGTYTVSLTASNAGGSDGETKTNYISVTAPPPAPVANFSGTPTTGTAPLPVSFTDLSTNGPTAWSWNFGDGGTSTAQNPNHTYNAAGTYTVTLTASNAGGSDGETKTGYISVSAPPDFTIAATPVKVTLVRGATASYTVTLGATGGFSGSIQLSVTGQPSGSVPSWTVNPVVLPGTDQTVLSIPTTSTTKVGSFTLTIQGTSGSVSHTAVVTLQVKRK